MEAWEKEYPPSLGTTRHIRVPGLGLSWKLSTMTNGRPQLGKGVLSGFLVVHIDSDLARFSVEAAGANAQLGSEFH